MPQFEPMNDEMFGVYMYDSGVGPENDNIKTFFVTDNRKMANEIVDELNELECDESFNLPLKDIQDDWIRQFMFQIGFKSIVETQNGNPFFYYEPLTFATRQEVETEEERQAREEQEQAFSDAIDEELGVDSEDQSQ